MSKRIILLTALIIFSNLAIAATGTGRATKYEVDVQEVKLCMDALCTSGYVLGTGSKTFDIASATAGAAVGSYAAIDNIPAGTYTYIRVILGSTFTITGTCTAGAVTKTAANTGSTVPNGVPIDAFAGKTAADGVYWYDAGKTKIAVISALPTPIVATGAATEQPQTTVKFNTSSALGCTDAGGGFIYPSQPDVAVTIQ